MLIVNPLDVESFSVATSDVKRRSMKPNFALNLSFDGIGLLHRVPAGWHLVGEVSLEAEDLNGALAVLLETGKQIDHSGVRTKVVLPEKQIKYITLESEPHAGEREVRLALDGATPYAIDELAYDWTLEGGTLHIAAVAKETLEEAEDFAVANGFAPISFVATPDQMLFPGEPFFGLTRAAASILPKGESVARDLQPIHVIGIAQLPEPEPEPALAEPEAEEPPAPEEAPLPEPLAEITAEAVPEVAVEAAALLEENPEAPLPEVSEEVAPEAPKAGKAPVEDSAAEGPTKSEPPEAEAPAPSFTSIRARRNDATPPSPPVAAKPLRAGDAGLPEDTSAPATPAPKVAAARAEPIGTTPEVPPASKAARASLQALAPAEPSKAPSAGAASATFGKLRAAFKRPEPAPAPAAKPVAKLRPSSPSASQEPQNEKDRLTVFGARKPKPAKTVVGGKPRFLGLALTAVLLLFLAGVAAWASLTSSDGIGWFFGTQEPPTIAGLPAADSITEDELAEAGDAAVELASLIDPKTDALPETIAPGLSEPQAILLPTAEESAALYAATGIWEVAPEETPVPVAIDLDDLYITSIDPVVAQPDAVALPSQSVLAPDTLPGSQISPVAPGTRFSLDERGFVVATPEGALTPDGVRVFAGPPVKVPSKFPDRTAAPERDVATADPRLAAFRPKVRPGGLVETAERSALGGLTRAELMTVRPKLRPTAIVAAYEAEQIRAAADAAAAAAAAASTAGLATPTPNDIVATSIKPKLRPQDLGVQPETGNPRTGSPMNSGSTFSREEIEDYEGETRVASAGPRTVQPKVPSQANVAKAATEKNAINLGQVNLIGVYGTPQSRRALIRLANGRFQKVKVGDRVDGGRVVAISDGELRYQKGGRNVTLKMPRG